MKRDDQGLLVSEECNWPGSIGDSCANTCRSEVLNPQDPHHVAFAFMTEAGFVRHPTAPTDWRESDFSDDQLLPLYMAGPHVLRECVKERLPVWAGNGTLHTPLTYAVIWDHPWVANICLLVQLAIMLWLPYRWSDDASLKWYERLESSKYSSADWLNWFCTCVYLKQRNELWFKPPIDKVARKVYDYYRNEPNVIDTLNDYEKGFALWG